MTKLKQVIQVTLSDLRYGIKQEYEHKKKSFPYTDASPEIRKLFDNDEELSLRICWVIEKEFLVRLKSVLDVDVTDMDVGLLEKTLEQIDKERELGETKTHE